MRFWLIFVLSFFPLILKGEVLLKHNKPITGKWTQNFSFDDDDLCAGQPQPFFLKISGKLTGKR